jgi:hypothetical protein
MNQSIPPDWMGSSSKLFFLCCEPYYDPFLGKLLSLTKEKLSNTSLLVDRSDSITGVS